MTWGLWRGKDKALDAAVGGARRQLIHEPVEEVRPPSNVSLRARRLELGMSQTELAERASMTQSAVSRLEAGGAVPTIGVLERLAAALSADLVVTLTPKAA